VQEKVALSISNACKDDKVKRGLGEAIAKNTDNEILKVMARNEHVQDAVANTIKNTVGNKEVQKKIGKAISDAAQDKETQKKVAQGMVTVGKGAVKGGALLGKFGLATAKFAYGEYTKSDKTDVKK
jgi:formylglycine-generating enzyme required for sulfatase activity